MILGPVTAIALGVYALSLVLGQTWAGPIIGIGVLFVLPACLAGIVSLTLDITGTAKNHKKKAALASVLIVLVLGGVIIREGIVCILMLTPLWLVGIFMGLIIVEKVQIRHRDKNKMHMTIFALLPFVILFADIWVPRPSSHYTVTRSIVIDARPTDIWPHLLRMDAIEQSEGQWTFAQNVMKIPRPRAAIVKGQAHNAVRYARWGEHIRFEEKITAWDENAELHWDFSFPDKSISKYTDRHIFPKGNHLDMHDGGYRLIHMSNGKTKLVLETNYIITTPINLYGKIWGEIILGGLQNNILTIVQGRAEK